MAKTYEYKIYVPVGVYLNEDDRPYVYTDDLRKISGVKYRDKINEAIVDYLSETEGTGLADHFKVGEKLISMYPSVEKHNRKLVGVLTFKGKRKFTKADITEFECWAEIECGAEWGVDFEEVPIKTKQGNIYVSFSTGNVIILRPPKSE